MATYAMRRSLVTHKTVPKKVEIPADYIDDRVT